jgi:hypothetical protein
MEWSMVNVNHNWNNDHCICGKQRNSETINGLCVNAIFDYLQAWSYEDLRIGYAGKWYLDSKDLGETIADSNLEHLITSFWKLLVAEGKIK